MYISFINWFAFCKLHDFHYVLYTGVHAVKILMYVI
jgi:hypothetical protein